MPFYPTLTASIINPTSAQLNVGGGGLDIQGSGYGSFGILIRDLNNSTELSLPFPNNAIENYFSGIDYINISSESYNVQNLTLGVDLELSINPNDQAAGGITALLYGNAFNQAILANQNNLNSLIKITVYYKVVDIQQVPVGSVTYTQQEPMILYHWANMGAGAVYAEAVGRGNLINTENPGANNLVEQHCKIRFQTLRPLGDFQNDNPVASFTTYTYSFPEQENFPYTQPSQDDNPFNFQLPANSLNLNPNGVIGFGQNINGLSLNAGDPAGNLIPTTAAFNSFLGSAVYEPNNGYNFNGLSPFNNIIAGSQIGFASFSTQQNFYQSGINASASGIGASILTLTPPIGASLGEDPAIMSYMYVRLGNPMVPSILGGYFPGCTDPEACNYDPEANVEDGSCTPAEVFQIVNQIPTDTTDSSFWDMSVPGQATLIQSKFKIAWGTSSTNPAVYNNNPFDTGTLVYQFTISVNGELPQIVAEGSIAQNTNELGHSVVTIDNINFVINAGDTIEYGFNATEKASDCGLPNFSSFITFTIPNNNIVGCTDSGALNYNPDATELLVNGCAYCNNGAQLISSISGTGGTPATNINTNDASQSIQYTLGNLFAVGDVGYNYSLTILEGAISDAALATFVNTGVTPLEVVFNETYYSTTESSHNLTFENLTPNVVHSYIFKLLNQDAAVASGCYFKTNYTTQYYACTDDLLNPIPNTAIYSNYEADVASNIPNIDLCTYTTDCNILNQTLEVLSVENSNTCSYSTSITYTGAIIGLTYIEMVSPNGDVEILVPQDIFVAENGTFQNQVAINQAGEYIYNMYTISPDGNLNCTVTTNLFITTEDLQICGCTDQFAFNYNANSVVDDGSCQYEGCTDPTALNYTPTATINTGCVYEIVGCMDPNAVNFNSLANVSDLDSCEYSLVPGCTDPNADNNTYNPNATVNDGTCQYFGCTDENATNPTYVTNAEGIQVLANVENGTCIYLGNEVPGCTDVAADNYNPDATVENGSCTYDGINGTTGPTPGVTLTVPNYNDFLDHVQTCVSKSLQKYYTKLITGQTCDRDRLVHLALVNKLLNNKQIKCLFGGSQASLIKLNKFIKFVLSVCDDCEYDVATSSDLVGAQELVLNPNNIGLQQANGDYVNEADNNQFVQQANDTNNLTI